MSEYLLVKSDKNFGVPEQKKFPLPDADHVRSAIKFFNYVEPKHEKELAKAILAKAEEFGVDLSEMNIGSNNRFKKYLVHSELYHHGIKGQKWGERRFQNEDGSLTNAGRERYSVGNAIGRAKKMVSGTLASIPKKESSSGKVVKLEVKGTNNPRKGQEFLSNDPDWKTAVDDKHPEQHAIGDSGFFMYTRSDGSRFMINDGGDTKWEIPKGMSPEEAAKMGADEIDQELTERTGMTKEERQEATKKAHDELIDKMANDVIKGKYGNGSERVKKLGNEYAEVQKRVNEKLHAKHSDLGGYELYHHGILGQKWGIRRFQNKDGSYTSAGKERRRKEDSYSDDYKKYFKNNKKNPKELSTKEIEELNRRDNAMNNYNRNRQNIGQKFVASLGNNILNGAAAAIGSLAVSAGMAYLKSKFKKG